MYACLYVCFVTEINLFVFIRSVCVSRFAERPEGSDETNRDRFARSALRGPLRDRPGHARRSHALGPNSSETTVCQSRSSRCWFTSIYCGMSPAYNIIMLYVDNLISKCVTNAVLDDLTICNLPYKFVLLPYSHMPKCCHQSLVFSRIGLTIVVLAY